MVSLVLLLVQWNLCVGCWVRAAVCLHPGPGPPRLTVRGLQTQVYKQQGGHRSRVVPAFITVVSSSLLSFLSPHIFL